MKDQKCKRHGTTLIKIKFDVRDLEDYIRKELRDRKFI